jgi:hypothetical protein
MTRMKRERIKFASQRNPGITTDLIQSEVSLHESVKRIPRPDTAARIANILGLTAEVLFLDPDDPLTEVRA